MSSAAMEAEDSAERQSALRRSWLRTIERAALAIFDEAAPSEGLEHLPMQRRVSARFGLVQALRGYGKLGRKLFESLMLPLPEKKTQR